MKKIISILGGLLLTFAFVTTASATPDPNDLVGWWKFDETDGGTAYDSSYYPDNGVLNGGIVLHGSYYEFDGVDDYVLVPHADKLDMTDAYTIEAYVYVANDLVNMYRPIIFRGEVNSNDIEVYVQANSKDLIVAHNRGNGGTFDYAGFEDPPLDDWFHLVVQFDGTNVRVYYDEVVAVLTQQSTNLVKPLDTDKSWWIGKVDHSAFGTLPGGEDDNYFKRYLDGIRIWDIALYYEDFDMSDEDLYNLLDQDGDNVLDNVDLCKGTDPESPDGLGTNRWRWNGKNWVTESPNGKGPKDSYTIEETHGCSCDQILEWLEDATVEEFEGHHKFGCSKSILEDWISGLYPIETLTVPANTSLGVYSNHVLSSSYDYMINPYGTACAEENTPGLCTIFFDAEYSNRPSVDATNWVDEVTGYAGTNLLDLQVNGVWVDWGTYNSSHEYSSVITGTDTPLHLSIYDVYYPNNTGNLTAEVLVILY